MKSVNIIVWTLTVVVIITLVLLIVFALVVQPDAGMLVWLRGFLEKNWLILTVLSFMVTGIVRLAAYFNISLQTLFQYWYDLNAKKWAVILVLVVISSVLFWGMGEIVRRGNVSTLSVATPTHGSANSYPIVYSKNNGEIVHQKTNTTPDECAQVNVKNFIAEVTVYNPSQNSWDYGFIFRKIDTGYHYRLSLSTKEKVSANLQNRLGFCTFQSGSVSGCSVQEYYVDGLNTLLTGSNKIRIEVIDSKVKVVLNDNHVKTLDLNENDLPGNVCIATGFVPGNSVKGQIVKYENFTIYQVP